MEETPGLRSTCSKRLGLPVLGRTAAEDEKDLAGSVDRRALRVKKCVHAFVDKIFRKDGSALWEEAMVDKEEWASMSGLVRVCNHIAVLRTLHNVLGEKPEVRLCQTLYIVSHVIKQICNLPHRVSSNHRCLFRPSG